MPRTLVVFPKDSAISVSVRIAGDRNVAFAGGILHSMRIPLTARKPEEDLAKIEVLRRGGCKTEDGRELTHYFTLRAYPGSEPHAASEELRGLRLSASTDEEASGDGHRHLTARGYWELPAEGNRRRRDGSVNDLPHTVGPEGSENGPNDTGGEQHQKTEERLQDSIARRGG
jgi:hypothetical protein